VPRGIQSIHRLTANIMQTTTYLITVTTRKEVTSLPEKIGARVWMLDGVEDVHVQPVKHEFAIGYNVTPTGPAV